jgi:hypothetical protein
MTTHDVGSVKAQSVEDARHDPAGEPVDVVGKYEVITEPGPRAIDDAATKFRQVRQQRRPCRPSVRAAVDQDDRRAFAHDLYPYADPCQLNALFDRAESHMRPEAALHFSIPMFVWHISPFHKIFSMADEGRNSNRAKGIAERYGLQTGKGKRAAESTAAFATPFSICSELF